MDIKLINDNYSWTKGKLLAREEAPAVAKKLRAEGKRLITVNGSFDLMHPGHLIILSEAKKQGDILFVGLNLDESVRRYKGPERPILPEAERSAMLCALTWVDYVVPIIEPEAGRAILLTIHPHIHVNGAEYGAPETWFEWSTVQEVDCETYSVPRKPGLATTDIIGKIKGLKS
ncbi:MAG: adenylyltransferase/cytidyltransferase family protein [bacterium]|nr:adenylyltransferase/cytidyltransferase family protein [bacterium]